jgi:hypothetical protein
VVSSANTGIAAVGKKPTSIATASSILKNWFKALRFM